MDETTPTSFQTLTLQGKEVQVPAQFICPITQQVMVYPVVTRLGIRYERLAILEWLARNDSGCCPVTRTPMRVSDLISDRGFQQQIEKWSQINGLAKPRTISEKEEEEDEKHRSRLLGFVAYTDEQIDDFTRRAKEEYERKKASVKDRQESVTYYNKSSFASIKGSKEEVTAIPSRDLHQKQQKESHRRRRYLAGLLSAAFDVSSHDANKSSS